ncbi:hypothetical protein IEQ34_020877 [Dendrobium chrysotoxum]|uniref:Uncharacterized protein n=1 Tax=Dendrobium chrysotoxum TaxID=161865 RepID=A0AAV7G362_DENCH|nr:hypothetical protein IEQ34_020877 [Dendrobium chrysotoxum]
MPTWVVVDVVKLLLLNGVKLNNDDVVGGLAVAREVKETEELAGKGGVEVWGRGDGKGETFGTDSCVVWDDSEDEGGGE